MKSLKKVCSARYYFSATFSLPKYEKKKLNSATGWKTFTHDYIPNPIKISNKNCQVKFFFFFLSYVFCKMCLW